MLTNKERSDDFYEGLAEMMLEEILSDNGEPIMNGDGTPIRNYEEYVNKYVKNVASEIKKLHLSPGNHWRVSLQELLDVAAGTDQITPEIYQGLNNSLDDFFNEE